MIPTDRLVPTAPTAATRVHQRAASAIGTLLFWAVASIGILFVGGLILAGAFHLGAGRVTNDRDGPARSFDEAFANDTRLAMRQSGIQSPGEASAYVRLGYMIECGKLTQDGGPHNEAHLIAIRTGRHSMALAPQLCPDVAKSLHAKWHGMER